MDVDHQVLHLSLPKWKCPEITMYPGNYVAHKLKEIHDDSRSVFPESVYSTASQVQNRWKSLTRTDYLPIEELQERALQKERHKPLGVSQLDFFLGNVLRLAKLPNVCK